MAATPLACSLDEVDLHVSVEVDELGLAAQDLGAAGELGGVEDALHLLHEAVARVVQLVQDHVATARDRHPLACTE